MFEKAMSCTIDGLSSSIESKVRTDSMEVDFSRVFDEQINFSDNSSGLSSGFDPPNLTGGQKQHFPCSSNYLDYSNSELPSLKRSKNLKEGPAELDTMGLLTPLTERDLGHTRTETGRRLSTTSTCSGTDGHKSKSWSHEEKTFLVGAVVDRFFRIGSLSSRKSGDGDGDDCWNFIKNTYDLYWEKYTEQTGIRRPCERTAAALSRHYKVMKAKVSSDDQKGICRYTFREYYKDFELIYNKINPLLGDKSKSLFRASSFTHGARSTDRKRRKPRRSLPVTSYSSATKQLQLGVQNEKKESTD